MHSAITAKEISNGHRLFEHRYASGSQHCSRAVPGYSFRFGVGYFGSFHLIAGADERDFRGIDRATSAILFSGIRTCDCSLHRRYIQQWYLWLAALLYPIVFVALLSGMVRVFDYRDSAPIHWWLCDERKPARETVSVFLVSSAFNCITVHGNKRSGRRVWLAGISAATTATQVRADLGRADFGRHLGLVALSSIPFERHASKRLVIHSFFCGLGCSKRDFDSVVQRIRRQHPTTCTFPFSTYQSDLA